jgi:hypothetical protein
MPFKSICLTIKVDKFCQQHFKTAIRLSAKLSAKQNASKEELQKIEHLIFVHLNAARRAYKLRKRRK